MEAGTASKPWSGRVILGTLLLALIGGGVFAWRSVGLVLVDDVELKSTNRTEALRIFSAVRQRREQLAQVYFQNKQYKDWYAVMRLEKIVSVEQLVDDFTKMRTLAVARTHEGRDYQLKLEPEGWRVHQIGPRPE